MVAEMDGQIEGADVLCLFWSYFNDCALFEKKLLKHSYLLNVISSSRIMSDNIFWCMKILISFVCLKYL